MRRVGVLGASFDPPTRGHDDVIVQAAAEFDELLLVPSVSHAFKKKLTPIENRLEMLRIFVSPWQEKAIPQVKIWNIEAALQQVAPSPAVYTYDVLSAIMKCYRATYQNAFHLRFIVGPDIAKRAVWEKFYRFQEVEKKWPLFIAKERVLIHSTQVRQCVAASPPDMKEKLIEWVGAPIMQYILANRLYQNVR